MKKLYYFLTVSLLVLFTIEANAQMTHIPDNNFLQALKDLGYGAGAVGNDIPTANINKITSLTVSFKNISDLTGIQDFVALIELNCHVNNLKTLDVSKNTRLIYLSLNHNTVGSLNLSSNKVLKELNAIYNNLNTLDVSENTNLTELKCDVNKLTTLDVSKNTKLERLSCKDNKLTTLDVSNNTALEMLWCNDNELTSLDVRNWNNANFLHFEAHNNPNLSCIYVNDKNADLSAWLKDATATFANNESECDVTLVTTFPFTETFETSSTTLTNWTQICENGNANWTFVTGANNGSITSAFEGTSNAKFIGNNSTGFKTKLVSPPLNLSTLSFPKLSFYLGQEHWNGDQNTSKVYYRTSATSPWVQLAEYNNSIDVWTKFELDLPNPSAYYQLAFEGTNNYGYANVIDLVSVAEGTPPPAVVTTFPFTETFETSSTTLTNWTQICENGNANWTFNTGAGNGSITSAFNETRNARFIGNSSTGFKTKLVSPPLNLSRISFPKLSFYLGQEHWNGEQNTTKVFYRTNATSPWVQLEEYTNSKDAWTPIVLDLPNQSATYQIAFEGTNNHGYANVIDLVSVAEGTPPPAVVTTFPFTETFETSSTTLTNWTQICENGDANWSFVIGAGNGSITSAFEGTSNAKFIGNNSTGFKTKLVSPPLNLSNTPFPKLSFYIGQQRWNNDQNTTKVFYRTSATSPWVQLEEYTNSIDDWTLFEIDLPNPSATYQLAFEGTNNYGYANVIDLVTVQNVPPTVATFPFIEDFETNSTTLTNWTQICENGNANWTFNTGAGAGSITTAFEGTRNARFIGNGDYGFTTKLVSPPLNLSSISSPKLSFYLGQNAWGDDQNTTTVLYRTSATSPWVQLEKYTNSIDDWTLFEIELPNPSSTYQLAFEGTNNCGYANVIDQVTVQNASIQESLNLSNQTIESGSNKCFNATMDITVAGGVTNVVVEDIAAAEFIAGESIRFLPGFHAVSGSYVYAHITTTGNFCTPAPLVAALDLPEEKSIEVETPPSDQSKLQGEKSIKVYPNPNNGQFTVELSNFESRSTLFLVNTMGSIVFQGTINENESTQFELLNLNKGIYFLQVRNGNTAISKKIVVN